jgi:transcriptional regulator with XRE-family HTH domain
MLFTARTNRGASIIHRRGPGVLAMKARQKYGAELQSKRRNLGLTQTELADIIGINQSSLSHIETGKNAPSFRTLERLRSVIDILETHYKGEKLAD